MIKEVTDEERKELVDAFIEDFDKLFEKHTEIIDPVGVSAIIVHVVINMYRQLEILSLMKSVDRAINQK